MVEAKNLGELRWYSASVYEGVGEKIRPKISKETCAKKFATEGEITFENSVPLCTGTVRLEFDKNRTKHQGSDRFATWKVC